MISYSQNFEDVMLERVFKQKTIGFYIDVGVWKPVLDSVTKHFYDKGWHGINIEPLKDNYTEICKERPRDVNLNIGLSNKKGHQIFHEVANTGLSTSCREFAQQHSKNGFSVNEITIPVNTLSEVCSEYASEIEIDFLKIDVEGAEESVIKGGNWNKYRPRVILVESTIPNKQIESFQGWEPILIKAGYVFAYFDGLNRFYVRNEEADLCNYFKVPPNVFDGFIKHEIILKQNRIKDLECKMQSAMIQVNEYSWFKKSLAGRIYKMLAG